MLHAWGQRLRGCTAFLFLTVRLCAVLYGLEGVCVAVKFKL